MNRLLFKKEGKAKYISHLDLMRTMQRVFIRAGVKIKHTEGFNPHPYMSFALPLSLGVESDCELLDFVLLGGAELDELPELITKNSPEGITVLEAYESARKVKEIKWLRFEAKLTYDGGIPENAVSELRTLYGAESLVIEKKSKKGVSSEDIAPMIQKAEFKPLSDIVLRIEAVTAAQNPSLSPSQFVSAIQQHLPGLAPDYAAYRRLEVYDSDNVIFR